MGLKKYEIITVGSDKRVRALRSWAVGDRYVNIGDVGGIVYDEKTLSQDGLCWLFRGNFGFPGARIGGDSIVDVGEVALPDTGTPNVDILGSSVVVGARLLFESDQTAADAVVLTAADFEQGTINYAAGVNWETMKAASGNYLRTKNPVFAGGKTVTLKCDVEGYLLNWYALDRDGTTINASAMVTTGVGVTTTVTACQYFLVKLSKNPNAPIVPADATAARITFTGTYEFKLSIVDSHVEINPAAGARASIIKPGASYTITSGAKYPEAIIRNSKVSFNAPANDGRVYRLLVQIIGSTATIDSTADHVLVAGRYINVKNLQASGILAARVASAHDCIQATDCNDFVVSPTIFPGVATAQTANMPFIFQGCNVPGGIFYHHAQIANTYKNIDFALAQTDLGKATASGGVILVSSEVEGMYRATHRDTGNFGALVESWGSVSGLSVLNNNPLSSYGTTIYKDAYLNGLFQLEGTNVFGNKVRSHPMAQVLNVQPRAVQGTFNTIVVGETITGVTANANRVCVPLPFRVNGSKGITINCPTGIEGAIVCTDINGVIKALTALATGESSVPAAQLVNTNAYIFFGKAGGGAITPADLAGVTVMVYNGCKIVNTSAGEGATAVNMKGNIRVEGNATLINASIIGTGYFGGNAVMSGMTVNGYAYMKDNTLCTKTSENVHTFASLVMEGNAVYKSIASLNLNGLKVYMYDNSKLLGDLRTSSPVLVMRDNATIAAGSVLASGSTGTIRLEGNAVLNYIVTMAGDITFCGSYNQTANIALTGKRVIDNHNAPEYDNNVKTQYDF